MRVPCACSVRKKSFKVFPAIDDHLCDFGSQSQPLILLKFHGFIFSLGAGISGDEGECLPSLSQVEARLVEFKTPEIKFCEKIRGLEFDVKVKNNKIENLMNELEQVKKEKEGLDSKLTGFESASKDLDTLLGSQRSDKNKEGLGYNDAISDYSRPSPIESNLNDLQNSNSSVFEHRESSSTILFKHVIKFVKAADSPIDTKTNKLETVRKSSVRYAEIHFDHLAYNYGVWVEKRKNWPKNNFAHKNVTPKADLLKTGRTPIRVNRPNINVAQPKMRSFDKTTHSYVRRPFQRKSAVRTQFRAPRVSTVNTKFPIVDSKFSTAKSTFTAGLGNKGKAVKASACWI
nr:hypothetical protein [Tanacetum cinerariifolium]